MGHVSELHRADSWERLPVRAHTEAQLHKVRAMSKKETEKRRERRFAQ